jgi:hypothetical protein
MTKLTAENFDVAATAFGLNITYNHDEPILALGLALKLHYTAWDFAESSDKLYLARTKANRLARRPAPTGVAELRKQGVLRSLPQELRIPLRTKPAEKDEAGYQELSFAYDGDGLSAAVAYVRLTTPDYPTGWDGKVRVVRCIPQHKDEIIELDFLRDWGTAVALSCITSSNLLDLPLGRAYSEPSWFEHLPALLFHQGFGGMTLNELKAIRYWD